MSRKRGTSRPSHAPEVRSARGESTEKGSENATPRRQRLVRITLLALLVGGATALPGVCSDSRMQPYDSARPTPTDAPNPTARSDRSSSGTSSTPPKTRQQRSPRTQPKKSKATSQTSTAGIRPLSPDRDPEEGGNDKEYRTIELTAGGEFDPLVMQGLGGDPSTHFRKGTLDDGRRYVAVGSESWCGPDGVLELTNANAVVIRMDGPDEFALIPGTWGCDSGDYNTDLTVLKNTIVSTIGPDDTWSNGHTTQEIWDALNDKSDL